ncbi:hypothetical protein JCM5350_002950 [Sporobolomyces pararoseus]
MPPRRARASSVSTTGTTSQPRRSSRKSITVLPPPEAKTTTKKSTPASKKVVKKSRRTSKIQEEEEQEDSDSDELTEQSSSEEEGEESTTSTGGKKRKAPTSSSSTTVKGGEPKKRGRKPKLDKVPKLIKPRKIIQGLNELPSLFTPFPSYKVFRNKGGFEIDELPEREEAPRSVFVFGTGDMGQHGLGTTTLDEIKRPRRHLLVEEKIDNGERGWESGVGELSCGGMHTLAIDSLGKVWSWGINDNAALGRLTNKPGIESEELEANPGLVEGLTRPGEQEEFEAVTVAAGDSVSLAVSKKGELKAWGSFRSAEGLLGFDGSSNSSKTQLYPTSLKNLEKHSIVQVECGDDHFLALTTTGYVFACGNGEQSQLGRKIVQRHKTHGLTPERLALKKIVLVGTGSYHSFAVDVEGKVFAWGSNSFNQLGLETDEEVISSPTLVESLLPENHGGSKVVQIKGGSHHSLFLFDNGQVWVVGRTDGHEVGLPDSHPQMKLNEERKEQARKERKDREKVELDLRIDSQTGQVRESCFDEETGETLKKEQAEFLAMETAAKAVPLPNDYVLEPTLLTFPKEPKQNDPSFKADDFDEDTETEETRIVSICAGTRHNFAISSRGYVYSWGVGPSSQLGQGNEEEVETPTRIWNTALSNVRAVKVETGGQHSVIVGVDREWKEKADKRKQAKLEREKEKEKAEKEKMQVDDDKEEKKDKVEEEPLIEENGITVNGEGEKEGEVEGEVEKTI